jgi:hypothetical protein
MAGKQQEVNENAVNLPASAGQQPVRKFDLIFLFLLYIFG